MNQRLRLINLQWNCWKRPIVLPLIPFRQLQLVQLIKATRRLALVIHKTSSDGNARPIMKLPLKFHLHLSSTQLRISRAKRNRTFEGTNGHHFRTAKSLPQYQADMPNKQLHSEIQKHRGGAKIRSREFELEKSVLKGQAPTNTAEKERNRDIRGWKRRHWPYSTLKLKSIAQR